MAEDRPKLLIVEDDPGLQKQLRWCFDGYEVLAADTRSGAIAALRRHEPPVVVQDLGLAPDPEGVSEGFATLLEILRLAPYTKVVVVTGQLDKENAVKAVGLGAYDFYQKELRPLGYKLHAEIVSYPGGMPGEAALILKW